MTASNTLTQLSQLSTLVADTADFELLKKHPVTDATTNPSLILAASKTPAYESIIAEGKEALAQGKSMTSCVQRILARAGQKILEIVPGRVSAEVDARLSFDTQGTIDYAYKLMDEFALLGVDSKRVLIKIASTWEGLEAARYLEAQDIHCNMTLIFHAQQAQVAAENGVTLISPFVGRILDFYKAAQPNADFTGNKDPGVISVHAIYQSLKAQGFSTQVMAASFRNTSEILELAGSDLLTISPALLDQLAQDNTAVTAKLQYSADQKPDQTHNQAEINAAQRQTVFRWEMNNDPMSHEKLADGIRRFAADQVTLEAALKH